jgi:hypothetical protein
MTTTNTDIRKTLKKAFPNARRIEQNKNMWNIYVELDDYTQECYNYVFENGKMKYNGLTIIEY